MISSKMVVRVSELPYGLDAGFLGIRSANVTTPLDQLDRELAGAGIPWWIIVLSAVIGVLLLALLIFVLWKVLTQSQFKSAFRNSMFYIFLAGILQAEAAGENGAAATEQWR